MAVNVRTWVWPAGLAAGLVLAASSPAVAGPTRGPGPVAPDQAFVGLVHGLTGEARVLVRCDGPVGPGGPTGHPVPGQRVEARSVPAPVVGDVGFTGALGTRLEV